MRKINIAVICLSCLAATAQADNLTKPLPVNAVGRVVQERAGEKNAAPTYLYSWPGVYFESAFEGTSVDVRLNDDENILNLIVDDQAPIVLTKPGKTVYAIKNLSPGTHKIRLEKRTETQSTKGRFEGFYISNDERASKVNAAELRIEFIGDSFTVGYGNTSSSRDCTNEQVFETTNTQLGFPPRVAKYFKADYQINASSGFGVVRNYNGTSPDKSLPKLYPYTLNDTSMLYQEQWKPHIIVIGLGTNDFSTQLKAEERWPNREALRADYIETYKAFIKALREKNPKAHFILNASTKFDGEIKAQVEKVIADLKASGETKIDGIFFDGLEYAGCHYHPSVKDDEVVANLLIEKIAANPKWWK
ncbi:MAG: endoglucanase E [Gammaproteobacteria bacterium]|nr:MAG: endoglucanase E [Gammaproteobacteria bacterium]